VGPGGQFGGHRSIAGRSEAAYSCSAPRQHATGPARHEARPVDRKCRGHQCHPVESQPRAAAAYLVSRIGEHPASPTTAPARLPVGGRSEPAVVRCTMKIRIRHPRLVRRSLAAGSPVRCSAGPTAVRRLRAPRDVRCRPTATGHPPQTRQPLHIMVRMGELYRPGRPPQAPSPVAPDKRTHVSRRLQMPTLPWTSRSGPRRCDSRPPHGFPPGTAPAARCSSFLAAACGSDARCWPRQASWACP